MSQDRERLHTAVLVAPSKERRKLRKQRRRAEARIHAEQRKAELAAARARAEAERAEQRATIYLPKSGEAGAARLRTPGRFRLPRHQDTSATLAGAYPFVAEGGLGADGVFVGQDLYSGGSFVYDPWVLYARGIITAPNVVLAGIVGSGKSSLAKSLYTRSLPFGRRVYVPGDPKGEHTAVAEAVGGRAGDPRPSAACGRGLVRAQKEVLTRAFTGLRGRCERAKMDETDYKDKTAHGSPPAGIL